MVKKYNDFDPQHESVVLTDKAKLSLYKKSANSGIPTGILEEIYSRGYNSWNPDLGYNPEQFGFDRVNSFIAGGFARQLDEDLRNWFNPSHPEGGWKRINSKGEVAGPCAREEGEPKPKCMSNKKIAQLSKKERAAAVAAKRRHDPVADRKGKGGKPINVSNYGKGKISEEFLEEKNVPTNPSLWSKAKSLAKSKFDVYPSAYANGWASKWYKSKGGGWKSVSEATELDEKCWTGYKQVGMKKKGERMVPNCVPVKENAEKHSKDSNKPSSRFIGSDELTDVYKKETPGQTVKRVVREKIEEAIAMPPAIQPPAIHGPQVAGVKRQAPTELSGRATGRMAGQYGSMSAKPTVSRSITRTGSASFGQVGAGPKTGVSPTKVTSSMSQGGGQVAQKMSQASPNKVITGMSDAGRKAAATVTKAAPTVAKGLGTVARIAGGPAATAAMAVMSPTPAGAGEDEKKRQETLKSYNPYKASGRSISDYEKETLTPKASEAPRPKVDAPTPPTRPEYFSRGQAFSAAREKAGGGEGQFKYDDKTYQTNIKSEPYIPSAKQKQTGIETESGNVRKKIKEAISEATYKGKTVTLNKPMKGDVKKSKVFVDPDGDGKAQKVNFGDKSLSIKKHIPARKKSYCARSGGQGNLTDKTSANYWSRRAWNCEETEVNELSVPAGTTGKRKDVSTPMVSVRMASGKIEKHPPGKSGSSGGGDE